MARQTPLPRFRLDLDPNNMEHNSSRVRNTLTSTTMSQFQQPQQFQHSRPFSTQLPRAQIRVRRSACSDLQSTTIPEERVYNGNRRRASLFVGRISTNRIDLSTASPYDHEPSQCDYANLCRQKCRSLYGSLTDSSAVSRSPRISTLPRDSFTVSDDDDDDDDDDTREEDIKLFQTTSKKNFRHSLPDTSPTTSLLRTFLKRNKTSRYHHHRDHRIDSPLNSSQSLCSSASSTSLLTNSSSALSTFRNFLSLVKLPSTSSSTKSINTTTSSATHHSSLTTLTGATSGLSSTTDQTTPTASASASTSTSRKAFSSSNDIQYEWHFQVSTNSH